jgi:hypothetical protein
VKIVACVRFVEETNVADVFACPECGEGVEVSGVTSGRQVRCLRCETLVEVPYLRRHRSPKRMSRTVRRLWLAGTVLAGTILLTMFSASLIGSKLRGDSRREFDALIAQGKRAESARDYGGALRNAIAALELAQHHQGIEGVDRIRIWRDALSRREVNQRLEGLEALDSETAFGEALILAERAATDDALSAQRDEVMTAVSRERVRDAKRRMTAAEAAFQGSRYAEALDHCMRTLALPGITTDQNARAIRAEATRLIRSIARRAGVRIETVQGAFALGTASGYRKDVVTPIIKVLRGKGYVIPSDPELLGTDWNGQTGYRLSVSIAESQDDHYLQSANRVTRIGVKIDLYHGGERCWYTSATGRTRVPPRNMSAFEAGHVAAAQTANPQAERRLFEDAVDALMERLGGLLGNVPGPVEIERESEMRETEQEPA